MSIEAKYVSALLFVAMCAWRPGLSLAEDSEAAAESSAAAEGEAEDAVIPPELTKAVEAAYPEDAWDAELEADVFMTIDISSEGEVGEVTPTAVKYYWYDDEGYLQEEQGDVATDEHGFVASAVEAIREYEFTPARLRDEQNPEGRPIPVRVQWKIGFVYEVQEVQRDATEDDFADADGHAADFPPTEAAEPEEGVSVTGPAAPSTEGSDAARSDVEGSQEREEDVTDPDRPVNFSGQVVERGTREPVSGVELQLFREPDGQGWTC